MELKVLPELKNEIPPLTDEEFSLLQKSVEKDGIRDPLVVWQKDGENILVDGHNRYELSITYGYDFNVVYKDFEDLTGAKIWIRNNQMARRNLTDGWKAELALRNKDDLLKRGREKLKVSGSVGGKISKKNKPLPEIGKPLKKETLEQDTHNTQEEIAHELGWSKGKVSQAEYVKKNSPENWELAKTGDYSINRAYEETKKKEKEQDTKNKYAKAAEKAKKTELVQSEVNKKTLEEIPVSYGDVFSIKGKKEHKLFVYDSFDAKVLKKQIGRVDCVLTDPPYGINYKSPSGSGFAVRGNYEVIENDDKEFDPSVLFEYSDKVITWGANHYANKLDNSAGWLVWDKRDGKQINNNSDCELAWTNMVKSARLFHHIWNGMIKDSERGEKRIHPTQKPVKLFVWALEICGADHYILDLFSGSGIALLACEETNRTACLVEKDPIYAAAQIKRFQQNGLEVKKVESILQV